MGACTPRRLKLLPFFPPPHACFFLAALPNRQELQAAFFAATVFFLLISVRMMRGWRLTRSHAAMASTRTGLRANVLAANAPRSPYGLASQGRLMGARTVQRTRFLRTGFTQPCAAAHNGATLRVAERCRAAYPELLGKQHPTCLGRRRTGGSPKSSRRPPQEQRPGANGSRSRSLRSRRTRYSASGTAVSRPEGLAVKAQLAASPLCVTGSSCRELPSRELPSQPAAPAGRRPIAPVAQRPLHLFGEGCR